MKQRVFNIGIMGCGRIARSMLESLRKCRNIKCAALASRTPGNAEKLAIRYKVPKVYNTYEELVQDPNIDLIYIATVNSLHKENALLCIANNKPCLVEKPFCLSYADAKEIVGLARDKGVFVAEAMITRYNPLSTIVLDALKSGAIGDVQTVTANIGIENIYLERMLSKDLGGGALYDLGVYLLNFSDLVYGGSVGEIKMVDVIMEGEVDATDAINISYDRLQRALLFVTAQYRTDNTGIIYGTKGRMIIDDIYNYSKVTVYSVDKGKSVYQNKRSHNGYREEIMSCIRDISCGYLESSRISLDTTLRVMDLMDRCRVSERSI